MRRHELTDEQWARLERLLPAPARTGRPPNDRRTALNGMLWVLKTGAPWRDLPERYGSWKSVYSRFRLWRLSGAWQRVLSALQREADRRGDLDWSLHFVDGSVVRAQRSAAGAKRGRATRLSG